MMENQSWSSELQRILDAIRSSDAVETRIQLLNELRDFNISDESPDLGPLFESLTTFWEDYTCLDVTQCMLNKAILSVASKNLELDISTFISQFVAFGTKVSVWCEKHLKMTLMSTEESQEEEHSKMFFQLLLDLLSFSATSFSALARCPTLVEKAMCVTETFIVEQLSLTKDSISESKRIHSNGSEVIKVAHVVIDAVIRLCGVCAHAINWNMEYEEANANHVITIIRCTIDKLLDIGVIAANTGGSLVSILNVSWKGVVALLQLGEGVFATKINIADIILTLISLVNESLKSTAKCWSSSCLKEPVSATEGRRKFLPVKFYLINAVKISCLYPCQAYTVHCELTHCILMISTFKLSMSHEKLLKSACDVCTELLEKTSFDLLNSLLNSDRVKQNEKIEVLDSLFINTSVEDGIVFDGVTSMLLGRIALFINLLRCSVDLEEDTKLWAAKKLGWVLDSLVDEDVYSSILVVQIPMLCSSGKNAELVWQPIFSSLLDSLKTFMIVISSSIAWTEVESQLLESLFHPHFLCSEIVIELWCFIVRHTESGIVTRIIDKLCSLMKFVGSSESVLDHGSGMRKVARVISALLGFGSQSMVDHVFKSFMVDDDRSQFSSAAGLALLMEGFPLKLLSEKMRNIATERLLADYLGFIDSFKDKPVKTCDANVFGVPIFAMSASMQFLPMSSCDIDVKTLRFLVSIIHSYRVSVDKAIKDQYSKLLSEALGIISNMKHLYEVDEMEQVVFELENLFISGPEASNKELYECRPNLAVFIAGLAHMKMTVSERKPSRFSAACELYYMMLRERHWALVHLAVAAFGYFSARTSCDELWRFVPRDAALSYDLQNGNVPSEERFMSKFKVFLDKETALDMTVSSSEQLGLLVREGRVLKEMFRTVSTMKFDTGLSESMEIDCEKQQSKKRKLVPEGISEGMELLQSGLKVIVNGLSQWQRNQPESSELHSQFRSHCSRLEDEIARLVGLAGSGNNN